MKQHQNAFVGRDPDQFADGLTEAALSAARESAAKAEKEEEKFFVYIITGLRDDGSPDLWKIRNPTRYLTPDAPEDKQVGDWKHAVEKMITFKKV